MELEDLRGEVTEELEKESKERWISYLALSTVLLAVCATLSSFKEGNNSVDTVLNQTQAANQWAYYQSKSIKGYIYEMQQEKLKLDMKTFANTFSPEAKAEYQAVVDSYDKKIQRYEDEKKEIMQEAKKFEKARDECQKRQDAFGFAVIFLQMGILLSSISALMKRKILWLAGCLVGVVGVYYFVEGMRLSM